MKHEFLHILKANRMKQILLLPVFLLLLCTTASASHIVGGDITYKHISGTTYEISARVYRDCFYGAHNANFDNPAHIGVFDENDLLIETLEIPFISEDTLTSYLEDPCLFIADDVCVHTTTYTSTITLQPLSPGEHYTFVYQRCCRNHTISNLINPAETGATYAITLDAAAMTVNNSTPDFGPLAPIFICLGDDINYLHAATENDGDELVYSLCTPLTGATQFVPLPIPPSAPPYTPVTFAPGYNTNNVLGGVVNTTQIDPVTGLITGIPTIQGQFVVGVCVSEYRNGVLLSTVRRDFEYNVGECLKIDAEAVSPIAQCEDLSVIFENTSSESNEYLWFFDLENNPSATSTEQNPTYTYPDTGSYTVRLIAEPTLTCADTLDFEVFLQYNSISASFDYNLYDCDGKSIIQVNDNSDDNVSPVVSWDWTWTQGGNVQTFNVQNPNIQAPLDVTGTLELTVVSENGCSATTSQVITTGGNNIIDLIVDNHTICNGESIELNPNYNTDLVEFTYNWSPATGLDSTNVPNPTANPTEDIIYNISASAFEGECIVNGAVDITVLDVVSTLTAPSAQCDNLTVNFENNSTDAEDFIWYFDYPNDLSATSTDENTSYTYPDTGTYTVLLIAEPTRPCVDTSVFEIFLQNNSLTSDFGLLVYDCDDKSILDVSDTSTDNLSPVVSWNWTVTYDSNTLTSTEQNPFFEVPLNVSGTIELTVNSQNGCESTSSQSFTTGGNSPTDLMEDSHTICDGESVELNPNYNPDLVAFTYNWSPSTGLDGTDIPNPTANPNTTTTYQINATAFDGLCTVDGDVDVNVIPLPALSFDYEIACNDLTVNFENTSENVSFVNWNFGDGALLSNTSANNNPSHTFGDYGTYTITLVSAESEYCKDTLMQEITLEPRTLNADFEIEYLDCDTNKIIVTFVNTSENSLNDTEAYLWSFSNGETSSEYSPTLTLNEDQLLTATLTITTAQGCIAIATQEDINIDLTEVNLPTEPVQVCLGTEVGLNPNGDTNYQYTWSPAGGLSDANAANPFASPSETTTYTVSIQNISADTCTIVHEVTTFVPPAIGLTTSTTDTITCEQEINLSSVTATDATVTWQGGDINSTGNDITLPVSGSTTYTVTATDEYNCTEIEEVTVSGGPVEFEFNVGGNGTVICNDETLDISINNLDANDNLSYQWLPTEHIVAGANTANPTFTSVPGIYTFTVNATSQYGCEAIDTINAVIYDQNAVFDFDYEIQCSGATIQFINTSQNAFGYAWDFGIEETDEDTSTEDNPTYTFPAAGVYNVTLGTIYDVDCVTSTVIQVTVPEILLLADFEYEYVSCETDEIAIQFTDITQNFLDNTASYQWTFSNGTTSTEQNPLVVLTEEQELTAQLVVTTTDDCTSIHEEVLNVDFIEENTLAQLNLCYGESIELNIGGNENYTYNWSPATGLSSTMAANPTASPTESTIYTVTIQNEGADECIITRNVTVTVKEEIGLTVPEDQTSCGETVTLTATTLADNIGIAWTNQNGVTFMGNSVNVPPTTVTTFYVTANDDFGCLALDTVSVYNHQMNLSTQGATNVCPNDSIVLEAYNNDVNDTVTWSWTAGENGTILAGGDTATPHVAVNTSLTEVEFYVTATNQYDCMDTDTVTLTMSDYNPTFDTEVAVCKGMSTPINPNANTDYQYQWSPATGLDNPNSPNPIATLEEDQAYSVTITDVNGIANCSSVETVNVIINPLLNLEIETNTTELCEDQPITLTATSNANADFEWSLSPDFNDIFENGQTVTVSPMGAVTYYLRGTDDIGCEETTEITINSFPLNYALDSTQVICIDQSETVSLSNNDVAQDLTFQWSPADIILNGADTATPTVNPQATTTLYVDIENQIGCTAQDSILLIVEDVVTTIFAEAEPDTILLGSDTEVQLLTIENESYKYEWSPSDEVSDHLIFNPTTSPLETTLYTVSITGELGCTAESSVEVVVLDRECAEPFIFIPNAFTPNNDGENDVLYVRGSNIEEVYLTIYNRWGERMFETEDASIGWDGTYRNEPLPPDVYGYYLKVKCFNGMEYFKKGNITLLR